MPEADARIHWRPYLSRPPRRWRRRSPRRPSRSGPARRRDAASRAAGDGARRTRVRRRRRRTAPAAGRRGRPRTRGSAPRRRRPPAGCGRPAAAMPPCSSRAGAGATTGAAAGPTARGRGSRPTPAPRRPEQHRPDGVGPGQAAQLAAEELHSRLDPRSSEQHAGRRGGTSRHLAGPRTHGLRSPATGPLRGPGRDGRPSLQQLRHRHGGRGDHVVSTARLREAGERGRRCADP